MSEIKKSGIVGFKRNLTSHLQKIEIYGKITEVRLGYGKA